MTGNVPGEPSQNQGAVDTAIRTMDALQSENAALRALLERIEKAAEAVVKTYGHYRSGLINALRAALEQESKG